jgi:hypothetical protein
MAARIWRQKVKNADKTLSEFFVSQPNMGRRETREVLKFRVNLISGGASNRINRASLRKTHAGSRRVFGTCRHNVVQARLFHSPGQWPKNSTENAVAPI